MQTQKHIVMYAITWHLHMDTDMHPHSHTCVCMYIYGIAPRWIELMNWANLYLTCFSHQCKNACIVLAIESNSTQHSAPQKWSVKRIILGSWLLLLVAMATSASQNITNNILCKSPKNGGHVCPRPEAKAKAKAPTERRLAGCKQNLPTK